jgi:hypothetical protein
LSIKDIIYVMVMSRSLVVSSINIDKSTMSWAITFDAVNVDVDHLQSSALDRSQ